ncbi:hypothetical protein [Paenibacillus baimaensis]|uniref:hypothetical protein n=1 Tax=Paenibacillus baimaensis TaxID=2982185 RepID=UPI0038CD950B
MGQHVHNQDEKNGMLHLYNQEGELITNHEKASGVHQVITHSRQVWENQSRRRAGFRGDCPKVFGILITAHDLVQTL